MGGFGGLSLAEYDRTPDWWILHAYLADFDRDHKLIPLRQRIRFVEVDAEGQTIEPAPAGPTFASLQIPEECLHLPADVPRPSTSWILMFWQVWRSRGKSTAWIQEEWRRLTIDEPRQRARQWQESEQERAR